MPTVECRSGDCRDDATYYVDLSVTRSQPYRIKKDEWDGYFCHDHMIRVLSLKLAEIPVKATLRIVKVKCK